MNVYLVEDCANAPGRILGVYSDKKEAENYAGSLPEAARVEKHRVNFNKETVDLVVDLTVALEGLLYKKFRDRRVDPMEVNRHAVEWGS